MPRSRSNRFRSPVDTCVHVYVAGFYQEYEISTKYTKFIIADAIGTLFFTIEIVTSFNSLHAQVIPEEDGYSGGGGGGSGGGGASPLSSSRSKIAKSQSSDGLDKSRAQLRAEGAGGKAILSFDFLLEVCATLPIEWLAYFLNIRAGLGVYLMLNRALRMLYLRRYVNNVIFIFEERDMLKNFGVQRAILLFSGMALAGHWCGCIFYMISYYYARRGEINTWAEKDGLYTLLDMYDETNCQPMDCGLYEVSERQKKAPMLLAFCVVMMRVGLCLRVCAG